jgi:hypothetical protein
MPVGGSPSGKRDGSIGLTSAPVAARFLDHIDVKGKIAVQLNVPQGHMVFERGPVGSQAQELMKRAPLAF